MTTPLHSFQRQNSAPTLTPTASPNLGGGFSDQATKQGKLETELCFNKVQLHILSDDLDHTLKYIGDIDTFKLHLSHFASVSKQIFSLGTVMFRYHNQGSYSSLLSIMTSNLITIEIHQFKDKLEYSIRADDIQIKLFKLEESLKFIEECYHLQNEVYLNSNMLQQTLSSHALPIDAIELMGSTIPDVQRVQYLMPKLNIDIKQIEIELLQSEDIHDEWDGMLSRFTLTVCGIKGQQKYHQNEINLENVSLKLFDYSLFEELQIKYTFDQRKQHLSCNSIPLQLDLYKLNNLLYNLHILDDISTIFKIVSMFSQQNLQQKLQTEETKQIEIMPQDTPGDQMSSFTIEINEIQISLGYGQRAGGYLEIIGIEIIQPKIVTNSIVHDYTEANSCTFSETTIQFQVKAHIIERFTLSKMPLLDKTRITLASTCNNALTIDLNHLKFHLFPESLREIQRLYCLITSVNTSQTMTQKKKSIIDKYESFLEGYRYQFINKTLKQVNLIQIDNASTSTEHVVFCRIEPNQTQKLDFIDLRHKHSLRFLTSPFEKDFKDPSAQHSFTLPLDLSNIIHKHYTTRFCNTNNSYFIEQLLDLDKHIFQLFVDCSQEDLISITLLERYCLVNKFVPNLKFSYGGKIQSDQSQEEQAESSQFLELKMDMQFCSDDEQTIQDVLSQVISFQCLDHASFWLSDTLNYPLASIYDDKISDKLTISTQVYNFPQQQHSSKLFELIVLQPYLQLRSHFHQDIQTKITFKDTLFNEQCQSIRMEHEKKYNLMFSKELHQEEQKQEGKAIMRYRNHLNNQKLSRFILKTLQLETQIAGCGSLIRVNQLNSQGTYKVENTNLQDQSVVYSKIIINQSFDHFKSLYTDKLGFNWVSDSQHTGIPITLDLYPFLQLSNLTNEPLYFTLLNPPDSPISLDSLSVFNVHKIKPHQTFDLCCPASTLYVHFGLEMDKGQVRFVTEDWGGEQQQGVLILKSLRKYIGFKKQSGIEGNKDEDTYCFVKADVLYNSSTCIQVTLSPAFVINKSPNTDNQGTLHRLVKSNKSITATRRIPENVPEDAREMYGIIMQSEIQKESSIDELERISPIDRIIKVDNQIKRIESKYYELRYDHTQGIAVLDITDPTQEDRGVVFELINNLDSIGITFALEGDTQLLLTPQAPLRFSSEKTVKKLLGFNDWHLQIHFFDSTTLFFDLNLDPHQLLHSEQVSSLYQVVTPSSSQQQLIKATYLKLTQHHFALIFDYPSAEAVKHQEYKIQGNIELKVSMYPFREQVQEIAQVININVQEINIDIKGEIKVEIGQIAVNNCYQGEGREMKMTKVIAMEEGIQIKCAIGKIDKQSGLILIKDLSVSIPDQTIRISFDESLKYSVIGFISQLQTSYQPLPYEEPYPPAPKFILSNFNMDDFSLILDIDLNSAVVLQIEGAEISFDAINLIDMGYEGDYLDYMNIALRHLTLQVFHSLHKILYHSTFMGNLPSIFSEARQDFTETLANPYSKQAHLTCSSHFFVSKTTFNLCIELFAMFPIMNIAAKGVFQFFYNVSSSFGSNLLKFTLGRVVNQPLSDLQNYTSYLQKLSQKRQDFLLHFNTLNPYQFLCYFNPSDQSSIKYYFPDCSLDIIGKNVPCHLIFFADQSLSIIYSGAQELKHIHLPRESIRKVNINKASDEQFCKIQIGLKKRTVQMVNEGYFQVLQGAIEVEIDRYKVKEEEGVVKWMKQEVIQ